MTDKNSRYKNSEVIAIEMPDGSIRKFVTPRDGFTPDDVQPNFRTQLYRHNENLEDIAHHAYGRSELWYFIAEMNGIVYPLEIDNTPDDITDLLTLIIPSDKQALAQLTV